SIIFCCLFITMLSPLKKVFSWRSMAFPTSICNSTLSFFSNFKTSERMRCTSLVLSLGKAGGLEGLSTVGFCCVHAKWMISKKNTDNTILFRVFISVFCLYLELWSVNRPGEPLMGLIYLFYQIII